MILSDLIDILNGKVAHLGLFAMTMLQFVLPNLLSTSFLKYGLSENPPVRIMHYEDIEPLSDMKPVSHQSTHSDIVRLDSFFQRVNDFGDEWTEERFGCWPMGRCRGSADAKD